MRDEMRSYIRQGIILVKYFVNNNIPYIPCSEMRELKVKLFV